MHKKNGLRIRKPDRKYDLPGFSYLYKNLGEESLVILVVSKR